MLGNSVASIGDLDEITSNYSITTATATDGTDTETTAIGPFVMSNSVYVDRDGKKAEAVSVLGHIFNACEIAEKNPVTIYVERVNAKVTVECKLKAVADGKNRFDTGVKVNERTNKGLEPGNIYVEFLGWDVTQATNKSYLMKHIDETWDPGVFGGSSPFSWNIPERYRSFWAINPKLVDPKKEESNYVFKSFNQHKDVVTGFSAEEGNYLYLQENAAAAAESKCAYPTQLIIAAQLVDGEGNPLTLAEYGFFQYTIDGLKTAMADKANIYKKDSEDDKKFVKIDETDIVLLTATEAGQASPTEDGRYYVYAAIKGTANAGENGGG